MLAGLADSMAARVQSISTGGADRRARWNLSGFAMGIIDPEHDPVGPSVRPFLIERIVSGGQTGADRAALDWAIEHNVPHGGWCPKGRKAEDGPLAARYNLIETPTDNYIQRTEWNVRDSDGTVIISISSTLSGGSRNTAEFADGYKKPWLHLSATREGYGASRLLRELVILHRIRVLNVAGPRAYSEPEVGRFVTRVLDGVAGRGNLPESSEVP